MKKMMLGLSAISFLLCCNDSYGADPEKSAVEGDVRRSQRHGLSRPGERPISKNHYKSERRESLAIGDTTGDIAKDTAISGNSIPAGMGDADIQTAPIVEGNAAAGTTAATISDALNSDSETNATVQEETSNGEAGQSPDGAKASEAAPVAEGGNPQETDNDASDFEPTVILPQDQAGQDGQ